MIGLIEGDLSTYAPVFPFLAPGSLGLSLTLSFIQPLLNLLLVLVAPQPVSALCQPSASTTDNPTSWQNRSIKDGADSSRYPARKRVTVDRGSATNRSPPTPAAASPNPERDSDGGNGPPPPAYGQGQGHLNSLPSHLLEQLVPRSLLSSIERCPGCPTGSGNPAGSQLQNTQA